MARKHPEARAAILRSEAAMRADVDMPASGWRWRYGWRFRLFGANVTRERFLPASATYAEARASFADELRNPAVESGEFLRLEGHHATH